MAAENSCGVVSGVLNDGKSLWSGVKHGVSWLAQYKYTLLAVLVVVLLWWWWSNDKQFVLPQWVKKHLPNNNASHNTGVAPTHNMAGGFVRQQYSGLENYHAI